jgi:hypothetical protein
MYNDRVAVAACHRDHMVLLTCSADNRDSQSCHVYMSRINKHRT